MTIWDFASEHYIIALFLFWLIIAGVFRTINRIIRSRNIKHRGWPPEHLDADGDLVTRERP